ncbi:MAG: hypothetical protein L0154_08350 [Chloroflexi bacterium]|nr:hypothetical protein [Chloroflexota bacterium]
MHCLAGNNRLFCLGFISLGVLLILLGMAQVSEARDPQPAAPVEVILPADICDVCHEDDLTTADSSVEQLLQRTAMSVIAFQRDHVLTALQEEQMYKVQQLLYSVQLSLLNGDWETAQILVQHANQLVNDLERQARLGEQALSVFYAQNGILTQLNLPLNNAHQTRRLADAVTGQGWTVTVLEHLPLAQLMAASMHRRAPPDEDAFVVAENLISLQTGRLAI